MVDEERIDETTKGRRPVEMWMRNEWVWCGTRKVDRRRNWWAFNRSKTRSALILEQMHEVMIVLILRRREYYLSE